MENRHRSAPTPSRIAKNLQEHPQQQPNPTKGASRHRDQQRLNSCIGSCLIASVEDLASHDQFRGEFMYPDDQEHLHNTTPDCHETVRPSWDPKARKPDPHPSASYYCSTKAPSTPERPAQIGSKFFWESTSRYCSSPAIFVPIG